MGADSDRMHDALWHIRAWCEAYPLEVFPEPDFAAIRERIGDEAMSALHASWARHIVSGISRYARKGLGELEH
jgi:hypothetical protein